MLHLVNIVSFVYREKVCDLRLDDFNVTWVSCDIMGCRACKLPDLTYVLVSLALQRNAALKMVPIYLAKKLILLSPKFATTLCSL